MCVGKHMLAPFDAARHDAFDTANFLRSTRVASLEVSGAIRQGDADGSADGSDGDGGGGDAVELAAHAADAVAAKGAAANGAAANGVGAPPKGPHSRAHLRGAAPDGDDAHSGLRRRRGLPSPGLGPTPVALAPALVEPPAPSRSDSARSSDSGRAPFAGLN